MIATPTRRPRTLPYRRQAPWSATQCKSWGASDSTSPESARCASRETLASTTIRPSERLANTTRRAARVNGVVTKAMRRSTKIDILLGMQRGQAQTEKDLTAEEIARYQASYRREWRRAAVVGFIVFLVIAPIWIWLPLDRSISLLIVLGVWLPYLGWSAFRLRCPHCRASTMWVARSRVLRCPRCGIRLL